MRIGRGTAGAAVIAALALVAACGDDDGASVREIGGESSGSGSASGSASASAPASGSASAPASVATGPEECRVEGGASGDAAAEVRGDLTEFAIALDRDTVPAGLVTLELTNIGEEPHEVVVIRGDDPSTLPTTGDGAATEESLAPDLVGEIEPFAPDVTCSGTFDLSPGTYVLLCNIVEEEGGRHESHFEEGMHTTLTVTG
jgi:hypothetical protein